MRLILILLILLSVLQISYGQERASKVHEIIDRLNLVDDQTTFLIDRNLLPLKWGASQENKAKLTELEDMLTDEEITKRIAHAFDEVFTDQEIDDLYIFVQTPAFDKVFNSALLKGTIEWQFEDVLREFDRIGGRLSEKQKRHSEVSGGFKPIPTEKEDGFYALAHKEGNVDYANVELTDVLSVAKKHIVEVDSDINYYGTTIIEITFDEEGTELFHRLTKEHIGKPIAVVVDKHIISMPSVYTAIEEGKVNITGSFSKEEIEYIIQCLSSK